jgi:hypothetical protein
LKKSNYLAVSFELSEISSSPYKTLKNLQFAAKSSLLRLVFFVRKNLAISFLYAKFAKNLRFVSESSLLKADS